MSSANGSQHKQLSLETLTRAIDRLLEQCKTRTPFVVNGVWDMSDRKTLGEIESAFITAFGEYASDFLTRGINVISYPCGKFRVDEAAVEVTKRAVPLRELRTRSAITVLNVAKIADTEDGRRDDHLFFAVTKWGEIIIGYTANESPILDLVLPYIEAFYLVDVPRDLDRNQNFRTRSVIPPVSAHVLARDAAWLSRLEAVPLGEVRNRFGVTKADNLCAWWPDEFGGEKLNIKTGIPANDSRLKGVGYGTKILVGFGSKRPKPVLFADSLHSSGKIDIPALCIASSGVEVPGGDRIQLYDLMVPYGGSAMEYFDHPDFSLPMIVEWPKPARTHSRREEAVTV